MGYAARAMIDTHCHLTDLRLLEQLDAVLQRAADAGVGRVLTIGTDIEDDRAAVGLCAGRPSLRCAVGIHPNYVKESNDADLAALAELLRGGNPAIVALGEMGLDYHYDPAPQPRQQMFLEKQLELAAERNLPAVIHCREAVDDTLAVMRSWPAGRAVFHCFTGTAAEAERILAAGYLISFTGVVTFKKSDELRDIARAVPSDRLLVETDAPWLSPEPVRNQKTNEPAFVMHTTRFLAELRGLDLAELERLTDTNAARLFGWE